MLNVQLLFRKFTLLILFSPFFYCLLILLSFLVSVSMLLHIKPVFAYTSASVCHYNLSPKCICCVLRHLLIIAADRSVEVKKHFLDCFNYFTCNKMIHLLSRSMFYCRFCMCVYQRTCVSLYITERNDVF